MTKMRGEKGIGLTTRVATLLDGHGAILHVASTLILFALFVAAVQFLTLEADEAWILLSAANAFGADVPPTSALANPTVSTGGAYLLIQGLLGLVTPKVLVHRAVSLLGAAGLLLLVYTTLRQLHHIPARAAAGTALAAAIPGFVLQAGLATGEILAVLILVSALLHWADTGSRSVAGAAMTGLLLGLACATRINCAAASAGLLAYAVVAPHPSFKRVLRAAVSLGVAGLVAGAAMAVYYHLSTGSEAESQAAYLSASTGLGTARKSVFQLFQNLDIFERFVPSPVLAAVIGAWLVLRLSPERLNSASVDSAGVLLFAGLAMLGAWAIVAPIPHLRYLWPAVACIWLSGTMLLLEFWRTRGAALSLAIHGGVLLTTASAILLTTLTVTSGESLVLVYQAIGSAPRTPLDRPHRFTAAADQVALSSFIASRAAAAEFFAPTESAAYPLTYLSGRSIDGVSNMARRPSETAQRIILLQPADSLIWRPEPAFDQWRRDHSKLVFRSGGMIALEVGSDAPPPPSRTHAVGNSEIITSTSN